jgi:hypothetical protein
MNYNIFNVSELHKKQKEKENNRNQIYKNICEKCFKKIREVSLNEQTFCFYTIPEYIVGLPLYNMTECIMFILNVLHEKGFHARYCDYFTIYISWNLPKPILKLETSTKNVNIFEKLNEKKNIKFIENYKPIEKYNAYNILNNRRK